MHAMSIKIPGFASKIIVTNKQLRPSLSYGIPKVHAHGGIVGIRAALPSGGSGCWGKKVVEKVVAGRRGARQGGPHRDVIMKAAISLNLDDTSGGGNGGGTNVGKKTGDDDEEGEEGWMSSVMEWWVKAFNVFAAFVLLSKGLQAVYFSLDYLLNRGDFRKLGDTIKYDKARVALGRGVVLSLEFLLISDILETVMAGASIQRLTAIGMTAIIRTIIDYFCSKEIDEALEEIEREEEKRKKEIEVPAPVVKTKKKGWF